MKMQPAAIHASEPVPDKSLFANLTNFCARNDVNICNELLEKFLFTVSSRNTNNGVYNYFEYTNTRLSIDT